MRVDTKGGSPSARAERRRFRYVGTSKALDNVCKIQMLYVVSYMCTIVGVYSCAVDANQCVRGLQRVGCVGATICEVRLNSETPTGVSLLTIGSTSDV